MIFAPDALPDWPFLPQTRIVHQLREGNANVNFYGWGDYFTNVAALIAGDLAGTPYRVVPTINKRANGRSGLMLVVDTPPINNLQSFDEQRDAILAGMQATDRLRTVGFGITERLLRNGLRQSNDAMAIVEVIRFWSRVNFLGIAQCLNSTLTPRQHR